MLVGMQHSALRRRLDLASLIEYATISCHRSVIDIGTGLKGVEVDASDWVDPSARTAHTCCSPAVINAETQCT